MSYIFSSEHFFCLAIFRSVFFRSCQVLSCIFRPCIFPSVLFHPYIFLSTHMSLTYKNINGIFSSAYFLYVMYFSSIHFFSFFITCFSFAQSPVFRLHFSIFSTLQQFQFQDWYYIQVIVIFRPTERYHICLEVSESNQT